MERRTASTVLIVLLTLSLFVSAFFVVHDVTGSMEPSSEWSHTYGGPNYDIANSMVQTSDGGYALAGVTWSFDPSEQGYLVKTDAAGTMVWNRTYGPKRSDGFNSVIKTSDGGYAVAGYSSYSGPGFSNFWLVKTNSAGVMQWNRAYGGDWHQEAYSVVQTSDGGYALAGYTDSYGAGMYDFWLVKTNSAGTKQWNRTYGGAHHEQAYSVVQTSDGGYALAGYTQSYGAGKTDFWLVKTDSGGNNLWNKTYGGVNSEQANSLVQTSDGGYALAGGGGGGGFWLVKTNSAGIMEWNRTYVGNSYGYYSNAHFLVQTSDGGYAMAGSISSNNYDFLLIKTDGSGAMQWSRTRGGTTQEQACSVVQTSDGGYAMAGFTGAANGTASTFDCLLVKLARELTIYIRADGSVDPPSAQIIREGNFYTLNDTICTSALEGIVIQRSNIILDGAGFTLQGAGHAGLYAVGNGIRIQDVSNVTVQNMNIRSFDRAIYINDSLNNVIQVNNVTDCDVGIALFSSSSNKVMGNFITQSANCTILLEGASDNTIQENVMTDSDCYGIAVWTNSNRNNITGNTITATRWYGIDIGFSLNTTVVGNTIRDNYWGIRIWNCGIFAYHNNFINNTKNVSPWFPPASIWDDGYPSGGNYWSDYAGSDFFSGPYQNVTGSDDIGDDGYIIDEKNRDRYPLMEAWEPERISTRYDWPMFHCNVERSGYTRSPSPSTLQKLWNYTTGDIILSSPTVVGRRVYVGSGDFNIYCLDALTGARVWYHPTGGFVHSSPAVANGRVYVGSYDRNLYCLSASTGETSWNYTTGGHVSSSPAVSNGKVYVGSWDNKIYCLNAETGAYIWSYTTGGLIAPSSPAVVNGRVYVGSSNGKVYCLNAETGTLLWSHGIGGGACASPAVVDGRVYIGSDDGKTYCLSAQTGEEVWNYTTGGNVTSSCAIADGKVYLGSGDGKVYCLNAETGEKIWNYTTGDGVTYSSPAVALGKLYVGSDDTKVYCLDALTGAHISNYATGGCVRSSPAVADNVVYVGSNDSSVYAFGSVIKVPEDYQTIQAAINAASPNDTIVIAPGIYNESVVINKRLTIIGQKGSSTTFAGGGSGVAITISGSEASGSIVAAVTITNYRQGILVDNSANCRIYDNIMYIMGDSGVVLKGSTATSNIIYGNRIYGNYIGINLTQTSPGNIIYSNTISQNAIGIKLSGSSGNTIYMNTFIGNVVQAASNPSTNAWDNGYPTGGNYWSTWVGEDRKHGPNQDLTGPDGIIDTPYEVSPGNLDRYPRMKPHDWIPPGDVNHDGNVNYDDLYVFSNAYGSSQGMPNWNENCDFQKDNKIEVMDLYHLGKNYGVTNP